MRRFREPLRCQQARVRGYDSGLLRIFWPGVMTKWTVLKTGLGDQEIVRAVRCHAEAGGLHCHVGSDRRCHLGCGAAPAQYGRRSPFRLHPPMGGHRTPLAAFNPLSSNVHVIPRYYERWTRAFHPAWQLHFCVSQQDWRELLDKRINQQVVVIGYTNDTDRPEWSEGSRQGKRRR
jgi:hypothetical protein